ncbi:MAG: hypothetical protein KF905_14515 [Flavobacteriales bacterium]|nr:hypothetical protein [Flavobacteriales bacterium]
MPGILLAIGYTALLLYFMRRLPFYAQVPQLPMRSVALLLLLKVLAGTALWAVYTWSYTDRVHADVFKYFDDSAVMFSALWERPEDFLRMLFSVGNDNAWFDERYYKVMNHWYREYESNLHNDAHTIIRFNAALRLLSFGEFHVHTVFAAFLSLTGMVALYRAFVGLLPGRERLLAIVIFLLPSVLFWASGVIKESLLFFGLGLLLWKVLELLNGTIRPWGLLLLAMSTVLLFHLKFYVIASLLPGIGLLFLVRTLPRVPVPILFAVVIGGTMLAGLNLQHVVPGFNILETIAVKQRDFIGLSEAMQPGSFVMPERLEPTFLSFLQQGPHALYIALLGPLFHSGPGLFGLVAAAENAVMLVALLVLLRYRVAWAQVRQDLVLALLAYIVLMSLVIGWTTPVMGAVVRYRTPLLPMLFIAALLLMDHRKLLARWPVLKPFFFA